MATCLQDQPAKWKQPCSEKHLRAISQGIAQWQDIAPFLDLTEADEVDIVGSPVPRSVPAQRLAMLRKWKQKLGSKATYKKLAKAFEKCKRQDLVDKIRELLTAADDCTSSSDEEGTLYVVSIPVIFY